MGQPSWGGQQHPFNAEALTCSLEFSVDTNVQRLHVRHSCWMAPFKVQAVKDRKKQHLQVIET